MMQVVEQTRDEKIAMYMRLTKRELVDMLLTNIELRPQWEKVGDKYTQECGGAHAWNPGATDYR